MTGKFVLGLLVVALMVTFVGLCLWAAGWAVLLLVRRPPGPVERVPHDGANPYAVTHAEAE